MTHKNIERGNHEKRGTYAEFFDAVKSAARTARVVVTMACMLWTGFASNCKADISVQQNKTKTASSQYISGYAVLVSQEGKKDIYVTGIHGTWTIPAIKGIGLNRNTGPDISKCSRKDANIQYILQLINLSSVVKNTSISEGVVTEYENGKELYGAFYTLPTSHSLIEMPDFKVAAGDTVQADIHSEAGSRAMWTITMRNTTENEKFSIDVPVSEPLTIAGWTITTPSYQEKCDNVEQMYVSPFMNFGTASFNNVSIDTNLGNKGRNFTLQQLANADWAKICRIVTIYGSYDKNNAIVIAPSLDIGKKGGFDMAYKIVNIKGMDTDEIIKKLYRVVYSR